METRTSKDTLRFNAQVENQPLAVLNRDSHLDYLLRQLDKPHNLSLSPLLPWLASWLANGLFVLLGPEQFAEELSRGRLMRLHQIADQIIELQTTGITGGKGQLPTLGNTYAGLVFLKTVNRLGEIDKNQVVAFIRQMKTESGFMMHEDGEADIRAIYCAVAAYSLLYSTSLTVNTQANPLATPEGRSLFAHVDQLVRRAQTYEGGFGGRPGEEAHGGYTYCAVAILRLLEQPVPNQQLLEEWLSARQDSFSHGFNGRTNKLVDSCYNFWVGACFKMLDLTNYSPKDLVTYTLSNCQSKEGGCQSSAQMPPDVYHTAYALLGLYILEGTAFNYVLGVPLSVSSSRQ